MKIRFDSFEWAERAARAIRRDGRVAHRRGRDITTALRPWELRDLWLRLGRIPSHCILDHASKEVES